MKYYTEAHRLADLHKDTIKEFVSQKFLKIPNQLKLMIDKEKACYFSKKREKTLVVFVQCKLSYLMYAVFIDLDTENQIISLDASKI